MKRALLALALAAIALPTRAEPNLVAANDGLLLRAAEEIADTVPRVPVGMLLCPSAAAIAAPTRPGCWLARGGQRVEVIAALPHFAQLRVWSSNGAETGTAWATRAAADQIQRQAIREEAAR